MLKSRIKSAIIWLLLACMGPALVGCGAVRLAYSAAPQASWWWLDGYFDFSREHSPSVRSAIDRWFDWHRGTQLPEYAALLAQAQAEVRSNLTPVQACRWNDKGRDALEPALQRAVADFADLVPGLREPQFKHLEQRYAKSNDELRADFMQADAALRLRESVKRTVDRAERVYGSLEDAQKKVIAAGVAVSPFSPEEWLKERQRAQRDTLQTLRRLVQDKADREQRLAALRALVQRNEQSPEPAYRAYRQKLVDYNCNLASQVHNATTAAQRLKAQNTLKGWEEDLKALVAQPAANNANGANSAAQPMN
jgi:Family of unknown function (DUF6279)